MALRESNNGWGKKEDRSQIVVYSYNCSTCCFHLTSGFPGLVEERDLTEIGYLLEEVFFFRSQLFSEFVARGNSEKILGENFGHLR